MTTAAGGSLLLRAQGYDHVNHATHDHKEEIKVGYNLNRRSFLMTIWALSPLVLFLVRPCSGRLRRGPRRLISMRQVAKVWLAIGIGGLLFRTVHAHPDVETALATGA